FDDANMLNIKSPDLWTHTILNVAEIGNDWGTPFGYINLTSEEYSFEKLLYWSTTYEHGIPLGESLTGFGYEAAYGPAKAPYLIYTSFGFQDITSFPMTGDPMIPSSPDAIAAGLLPVQPPVSSIPEPSTLLLLAIGLIGILSSLKKQARQRGIL
ncbi:MAG: PEP-CTERM sorting domain-containing protein, partial [Smithellaceae bacterium]